MKTEESKSVAIIVTHPDEETLWAGGTILSHPLWNCFVVCLSNANDPELAPRFYNALKVLKSEGIMGDLDEISDLELANTKAIERSIVELLPDTQFDIIITHNSAEKNTNNRKHEAVNKTVTQLWEDGIIAANELWTFANENNDEKYYSKSLEKPDIQKFSKHIWSRKHKIITRIFGYNEKSWQAKITPFTEAFWKYRETLKHQESKKSYGYSLNIFRATNIEALKFLYRKSVSYMCDTNYWKYNESSISETFHKMDEKEKAMKKKWGRDLSIFNTPSIDYLKTLYYKSLSYFYDSSDSKTETSYSEDSMRESDDLQHQKKLFRKFKNELQIFKAPTIESLKSLYNKSMAFVFEKNRLEAELALSTNETNRCNKTIDKFEKELNIFNNTTIESLKKMYYKSRQQN